MPDQKVFLNGIDGVTGQYLVDPFDIDQVAAMVSGETRKPDLNKWLANIWRTISTPFLGLPLGVDPADPAQAGWGIVFLKDEDPAVKAALLPLIEHRQRQIGSDRIVKVLDTAPGEEWDAWLGRHGVAPGSVEPGKVPYYLLLVGDPQRIGFQFGQLLDVEYGVGWLHFDSPGEYSRYASSVIEYETGNKVPNGREAVFFGTRHNFDQATKLSADFLVNPLADGVPASGGEPAVPGVAQQWGYRSRKVWGNAATKAAFLETISPGTSTGNGKPPALVFTASHGMGFPKGHASQRAAQGALLCQDWPGFGNIGPDHYFGAQDVPAEAQVHGTVFFHFACFGGGTPERDQFLHEAGRPPPVIADGAFLSALPKTWLSHPGGGALACIGHVERAWGYSIIPSLSGPQLQTFQNALGRILTGQPLGYALKDFNERYAALSTGLSAKLQKASWGTPVNSEELASNWIERNDAEGYILIGDPAVRLRADKLT